MLDIFSEYQGDQEVMGLCSVAESLIFILNEMENPCRILNRRVALAVVLVRA